MNENPNQSNEFRADISDMQKIRDALVAAETFLWKRDEMNAQMHCAAQVRTSPLTSKVSAAVDRLSELMGIKKEMA